MNRRDREIRAREKARKDAMNQRLVLGSSFTAESLKLELGLEKPKGPAQTPPKYADEFNIAERIGPANKEVLQLFVR